MMPKVLNRVVMIASGIAPRDASGKLLMRSAVFVPDEGGDFRLTFSARIRNDRDQPVDSTIVIYFFYDILTDSVLPQ
jgi:hypothetical protein